MFTGAKTRNPGEDQEINQDRQGPNVKELELNCDAEVTSLQKWDEADHYRHKYRITVYIFFKVAKEKAVNRKCIRTGTASCTKCLWRLSKPQ